MSVNCGIVGLPNVGKSTLFKALTTAFAESANYPFCTIEPNIGIVDVADTRLRKISEIIVPRQTIPATVEFVDIAGLVKGASKGEGLGNQFLGHIRSVNAIVHVVRCFDDDDVVHVNGKVSPLDDMEVVEMELALADIEIVERRLANLGKREKSHDNKVSSRAKFERPLLLLLKEKLEKSIDIRSMKFNCEEKTMIEELNLITFMPLLIVCNIDENSLNGSNKHVERVLEYAKKKGVEVLTICSKLESEIVLLESDGERQAFMSDAGITESGLERLSRKVYSLLGLRTYFTAGEKEVRAWTFPKGIKAKQAAGIIHSDFEKGFVKAHVYHCDDLFSLGSEQKIKESGKLRVEGKDYSVNDGDIIHFLFNV